MYYDGEGVPKKYKEAVKWFQKAAEQGHAEAQGMLGFLYYSGEGLPQDYVEAMKWYRKVAEQGYAGVQYELGVMYLDADGVTHDNVEAYAWLLLAKANGMKEVSEGISNLRKRAFHGGADRERASAGVGTASLDRGKERKPEAVR